MNLLTRLFSHKHRYEEIRVVSADTKELKCTRWPEKFAMNIHTHEKTPLTPELKKQHDALAIEYEKRFMKG